MSVIIDYASAWVNAQSFIPIVWSKPKHGWFKLNVDGARCPQNSKIGDGGLIRDYSGVWIEGFNFLLILALIDQVQAEILGLYYS